MNEEIRKMELSFSTPLVVEKKLSEDCIKCQKDYDRAIREAWETGVKWQRDISYGQCEMCRYHEKRLKEINEQLQKDMANLRNEMQRLKTKMKVMKWLGWF